MAKTNSTPYQNAVRYVGSLRLMERAYLLAFLKSGALNDGLKELPAAEYIGGTNALSVLRQVLEMDLQAPMAVTPLRAISEA